jgi:plasmid stabilization system protein ParE
LAEIWAYIAQDKRKAADRFMAEFKKKFDLLTKFPEIGAHRDQLAESLRGLSYGRYMIYYIPTETEIVIVRVLHAGRDAAAIFGQGA